MNQFIESFLNEPRAFLYFSHFSLHMLFYSFYCAADVKNCDTCIHFVRTQKQDMLQSDVHLFFLSGTLSRFRSLKRDVNFHSRKPHYIIYESSQN